MSLAQQYRSVLRQFVKNSIHPRAGRSASIQSHLRQLFDSAKTLTPNSPEAKLWARDVDNMVVFMSAHRIHKELLDRYNSTGEMSGEERATKSAGMVGLGMPQQFEQGRDPTMEYSEKIRREQSGKGTLQEMFKPEH
ncbi:hypothetical protein MNV49_007756 [Pseudohyphozyma bogoriensis]|nr:hypothetical protein MNV49_007756 [Pseudohyphozyma bogoriensis]